MMKEDAADKLAGKTQRHGGAVKQGKCEICCRGGACITQVSQELLCKTDANSDFTVLYRILYVIGGFIIGSFSSGSHRF